MENPLPCHVTLPDPQEMDRLGIRELEGDRKGGPELPVSFRKGGDLEGDRGHEP